MAYGIESGEVAQILHIVREAPLSDAAKREAIAAVLNRVVEHAAKKEGS